MHMPQSDNHRLTEKWRSTRDRVSVPPSYRNQFAASRFTSLCVRGFVLMLKRLTKVDIRVPGGGWTPKDRWCLSRRGAGGRWIPNRVSITYARVMNFTYIVT